jgi:hypothetical protein
MAHEESDDYYVPPTLGELSRALARERGELRDYDLRGKGYRPPAVPGGMPGVNQAADLNRETNLIERTENYNVSPRPPALLYEVIATYDSRPIQGFDFQHSECSQIEWIPLGGGSTFDPIEFTFTVPENNIAVLRKFRYQVTAAPVNHVTEGDCWLMSSLLVDDSPVREYNRMLLPVYMQLFQDVFLIVDERRRLTLKLFVANDGVDDVEFFGDLEANGIQNPVLGQLYGQLLVKTGVPQEFEIANAIGGGQF